MSVPSDSVRPATAAPDPVAPPPATAPARGPFWRRRSTLAAVPTLAERPSPARLRRHRRLLARRRQDALFHLGGLAFELHRRNRLTDEVMRLRAAEVADLDRSISEIDVWLGEVARVRRERRGAVEAAPAVGACLRCRAPFGAEARFCARCGAALTAVGEPSEQVTSVIAAGPAPPGR